MMIIGFFLLLLSTTASAQVVLDGSLGPAGALEGPEFQIEAHLGQQRGNNLFHSFETFNLNRQQHAIFTGPESIQHLISRVTGGKPSMIDGQLSVWMPQADVYFLNPAGVMLGYNAQIDVAGSFYISTADYLKLGETGRFTATTPESSLLTVAPPSAFGFLNESPGPIQVEDSWLFLVNETQEARILSGETAPRRSLSLIGGDISLKNSVLFTFGHDANIISVASAGEVPLDLSQLTADSFRAWGQLQLINTTEHTDYGNIDASGLGGGQIDIRAGDVILDNAWVFADTWGAQVGRGITIRAQEQLALQNASRITTESYSLFYPMLLAQGQGGPIHIAAGDISLTGGSQINSSTRINNRAGDITLSARQHFFISGSDQFGFDSGVLSQTLERGNGGNVNIRATQLTLDNNAVITTKTVNPAQGHAGTLSIQVDTLELLNGAQIDVSAGIPGPMTDQQGRGHAGDLKITAHKAIRIRGASEKKGGSGLLSNALNQGQGGRIEVMTPTLTLEQGSSIESATQQGGDAGHIVLNVDTLKLADNSKIDTKTLGQGGAGDVTIVAQKALLIENAQISLVTEGKGPGGNAEIKTHYLQMSEHGVITAESSAQGSAGHVVLIIGDKLLAQNSAIKTSTQGADGGNISITTSNYLYLMDSEITTSVHTQLGDGGNITLNPEFIILDVRSYILAQAIEGHGGDIDITTAGIYSFSKQPLNTLINASSEQSVDGIITISSPESEVTEQLIVLSAEFFDAAQLLGNRCKKITLEDIEQSNRFVLSPQSVKGIQADNFHNSAL